jgi:hypothetical protein
MSQQAFNGHSFNVLRFVPCGAIGVLFIWGPQTALAIVVGMGGQPVLKQMFMFASKSSQPIQPHVSLL